jgi:hypothetical protein
MKEKRQLRAARILPKLLKKNQRFKKVFFLQTKKNNALLNLPMKRIRVRLKISPFNRKISKNLRILNLRSISLILIK